METMRDIERRIDSVENTKKITRAMKMVASAKLKSAQDLAEDARPFFNKTKTILNDIVKYTKDVREHPLLTARDGNKHLIMAIGADRGLCGPFNNRIISRVQKEYEADNSTLFLLGGRIRNYFKRRDYDIVSEYVDLDDYPGYEFARKLTQEIISLYQEEIVDKVSVVYTHFNSALDQDLMLEQLIPVSPDINEEEAEEPEPEPESEEEKEPEKKIDYIYEPSPEQILDVLLPKYVNNMIYSMLLESKASEFGARMTAMDSATENAEEMIEELTLSYNRARQAEITKEITEIVGGAGALEQ